MPELRLITLEKLLEMDLNDQAFALVEVLGEDSYEEGHLPGAVNIPTPPDMTAEQMAEAAGELGIGKDDRVVVYCASYTCQASTRAARLLLEAGFTDVLDYKAGKATWKTAGFEFEPAEA